MLSPSIQHCILSGAARKVLFWCSLYLISNLHLGYLWVGRKGGWEVLRMASTCSPTAGTHLTMHRRQDLLYRDI